MLNLNHKIPKPSHHLKLNLISKGGRRVPAQNLHSKTNPKRTTPHSPAPNSTMLLCDYGCTRTCGNQVTLSCHSPGATHPLCHICNLAWSSPRRLPDWAPGPTNLLALGLHVWAGFYFSLGCWGSNSSPLTEPLPGPSTTGFYSHSKAYPRRCCFSISL